ncbi:hypothetical protein SCHPADRAFT_945408 [Schizopora paradoxa]|uniref:Uncharacterized protein n=1 Tax=Schizopora paradoxa TaxID=27342 RepID=A0A0H2R604_9AGAM|nr:hypothetical protein SCHPADRAFT_945408 [Schizopora paradoxa]
MFVSKPLAVVAAAFLAGTMLVAAIPTPPEVATVEASTSYEPPSGGYEPPYVPAPEPAAGPPSEGLVPTLLGDVLGLVGHVTNFTQSSYSIAIEVHSRSVESFAKPTVSIQSPSSIPHVSRFDSKSVMFGSF